jgi:hypothetical protein
MAPQPRQHVGVHGAGAMVFDAAWAASLVRHAADDEGGGAVVVLPALVRCLAVASAVLPPASCDAQHRQLRVALQQLECASGGHFQPPLTLGRAVAFTEAKR